MKNTWHIHIKGIVQGVGFRPFVYQLAHKLKINGWVNNDVDGVHIEFNADTQLANEFFQKIITTPPPLAEIIESKLAPFEYYSVYDDFQIIHSNSVGTYDLKVTPDYAFCDECRIEMQTPDNRRYGYAFTTCTNCGPRYSIINKLPYDRMYTRMAGYTMCEKCHEEYHNPLDRRYYSQTNSCHDCGIKMTLLDNKGLAVQESQAQIIGTIVTLLQQSKIIAIKGIGGYLIIADASNDDVVQKLRIRKNRPQKPFALMYPSIKAVEKDLVVSQTEKEVLLNMFSPIVLLRKKKDISSVISPFVAPELPTLGVMLPYTPLFTLLLGTFDQPIIATSGNLSGSSIVFKDKEVVEKLGNIVDYILTNDRDINISQDDSVVCFSTFAKQKITLRRARGIAPNFIQSTIDFSKNNCLALGGNAKSTFSIAQDKNVFISQYLGNLDSYEAQVNYDNTLNHFMKIVAAKPATILIDKHPAYHTYQVGKKLAEKFQYKIKYIQHHKAHFAAILGEHNLIASKEKILGVIWDGTGWGDDQQIWGGEFFIYQNYSMKRSTHFEYFNQLLGDKMSIEPRLSALSLFGQMENAAAVLSKKFDSQEWRLYKKMILQKTNIKTASVGRLFDAVASLLGLIDKSSYEAEAAIKLEVLAREWIDENGLDIPVLYPFGHTPEKPISIKKMKAEMLFDISNKVSRQEIAYKFHETLVQIIATEAKSKLQNDDLKPSIAFSGGVFQNAVLVDIIHKRLSCNYHLYFHSELSSGDENISFGQIIYHKINEIKKSLHIKNKILCV